MITYLVFGIILILLNIFLYYTGFSDKAKLTLNALFLIAISGLRSINIGADVENYGNIFRIFGTFPLTSNVSDIYKGYPFYRILCKTVYLIFNGNYQFMMCISAIIIIYGVFKFIYYYSDNCTASLFYYITLYYFFFSWNGVRQSIAMSLFFLSVIAFDEKKYIKFALLFLFTIFTHNVAILMYIYLILKKIKWNKILLSAYSVFLFLAMSLLPELINLFISVFPRYAIYSNVLYGDISIFGGNARGRKIILSIIFLLFIAIALLIIKSNDFDSTAQNSNSQITVKRESLWTVSAITMIEIVIGIMFSTNTFYLRIQTFFSIFSILLLPAVIERIDKKWRTLIYIGTNMLFLFTAVIRMTGGESAVYPYEFFWQI